MTQTVHDKNGALGLVQIYTGPGKGKTTAALGLAIRAIGHGMRVVVIQFLKGKDRPGEVIFAEKFCPSLLRFHRFGTGEFIINRQATPEEVASAKEGMAAAAEIVASGGADILILDEISHAVNLNLVSAQEVNDLLAARRYPMEIILTGRDFPEEILEQANLISEIQEIKHPVGEGISARKGIEY